MRSEAVSAISIGRMVRTESRDSCPWHGLREGVWEFIVEPQHVDEFKREYGPQGSWVKLSRQAPGYLQTLLLRNSTDSCRFVLIDRGKLRGVSPVPIGF